MVMVVAPQGWSTSPGRGISVFLRDQIGVVCGKTRVVSITMLGTRRTVAVVLSSDTARRRPSICCMNSGRSGSKRCSKSTVQAEKPYVEFPGFAAIERFSSVGMVRVNRGVMACLAD